MLFAMQNQLNRCKLMVNSKKQAGALRTCLWHLLSRFKNRLTNTLLNADFFCYMYSSNISAT